MILMIFVISFQKETKLIIILQTIAIGSNSITSSSTATFFYDKAESSSKLNALGKSVSSSLSDEEVGEDGEVLISPEWLT